MNNTEYITINTNLYSNVAFEIIQSVVGQLSDGWGENSPANEKWWKFVQIEKNPYNNVAIKISADSYRWPAHERRATYNGFHGMSKEDVFKKFASWIKKTVQMELKDNGITDGWRRDNDMPLSYLGYDEKITVAEAYFIYEYLLRRLLFVHKYDRKVVEAVHGEVASEEAAETEEKKRAAGKKITEQYKIDREALDRQENDEIARIKVEFDKKRAALFDKFRAEVKEIRG